MPETIEHCDFPDLVDVGEAPFCSVVRDEGYAFLAGVVAADFPEGRAVLGDVGAETTAVMHVIQGVLKKMGLSMNNIMRCDVHLTNLSDMNEVNIAYSKFFPTKAFPARTCTQTGALYGNSKVEITCVAKRT